MKGKLKKTGTKDRISYLYISHGAIRHSSERITTETDVEFGYLMMPTEAKIKIGTKIRREVERGSNLFCLFYVGDFARGYANSFGEYMAYGSASRNRLLNHISRIHRQHDHRLLHRRKKHRWRIQI